MPITAPGYRIESLSEAPSVPCPCGISTRPLPAAAGAPCSLHVTQIHDAARHHHKQTTEVYYILEGTGTIELNDQQYSIQPGDTIWIHPGTWHAVRSEAGLRTIVVAIPPFQAEDEYLESVEVN